MNKKCPKCGTEISLTSRFCPNCGQNLEVYNNSHTFTINDSNTPLQLILHKISCHKRISIGCLVLIAAIIGSVYLYRDYKYKQEIKNQLEKSIRHLEEISGVYTSSSGLKLNLNIDGTASIKEQYGSTHLGYWNEKAEGIPIEIEFSESFEISIGNESDAYCSSLYFYDGILWRDMDAIRSRDYSKCIFLTKKK